MSDEPQATWPPRITITPEGAAAIFIMAYGLGGVAGAKEQQALADLLKEYWRGGYDAAKRGEPRS